MSLRGGIMDVSMWLIGVVIRGFAGARSMIIALVEHIAFSARRRWAPHSNQAAFSSNRKLQTAGGRGSVCYGATAHTLNAPHSWRPALFNTACMQWRIPLVWLEKWSFSVQKHENTFARVFMCFVRDLNSLCSHRKFFNVFILKNILIYWKL